MMKIRFWGTRGSIASPGKGTVRYGGNTSCVEVRIDGQILIFDAGTGIRNLGNHLIKEFDTKPVTVHLFISHTHWDHIQGFPFFIPAYRDNFQIKVYGPPARGRSLRDLMKLQMASEYFPVPLGDLSAQIDMQEVSMPLKIGNLTVTPFSVNHPARTLAYKITDDKSFVYASDNEPYRYKIHDVCEEEVSSQTADNLEEKFVKFLAGADFLVCEAQYTMEEYKAKIGWGHSPIESVIEFAQKAGVKKLAIFHHDPAHDDETVDEMIKHAQQLLAAQKSSIECIGAYEGLEVTLP
jgi:phosphoribosyl 1,2-cyclic phosphodiesterase